MNFNKYFVMIAGLVCLLLVELSCMADTNDAAHLEKLPEFDSPQSLTLISNLVKNEDWDKLIANHTHWIETNPRNASLFCNRASFYLVKGEPTMAIKDFDVCLKLCPTNARTYESRAMAFAAISNYPAAIKDLTSGLELQPEDAVTLNNRARLYEKTGMYQQSLDDFHSAISIDDKYADTWNSLAWFQSVCPDKKFRDGVRAVQAATQACELSDWKRWEYLDTLSMAFAESGNYSKAIEVVNRAGKINPLPRKATKILSSHLDLYQNQSVYRGFE